MTEEQVIEEIIEYCRKRQEESGVAGGYYQNVIDLLKDQR